MHHEFTEQFNALRDEFRSLKTCIKIKGTQNEEALDKGCIAATMLNSTERSLRRDLLSASVSNQMSPFGSSASSHSFDGFEIAHTTRSSEPKITTASGSSVSEASLPCRTQRISDQDENSSDGTKVPPTSRKGHRKSREGCFNCKRRKIKCQETQPACENCAKKNLNCSYPVPRTLKALQGSLLYSSTPIASINLQGTPTIFDLTDMRLFHHFLMDGYPHLPVGNDSAWLSQVPLIAHHNEYLMHAILGLSASHLELLTRVSLGSVAIHHRLLAIQGSNAALSSNTRTGSDGDALLASCYLLAFQSSYMKDGILEFFTMVRGCSLLSNQLREEKLSMAFFLVEKDHFQFMEERLLDLPAISPETVEGADESLAAILPICTLTLHSEFYQLLDDCIEATKTSSLRAYFKFVSIYQGIAKMDNENFQKFMDPSDTVARILIAHFLALQLMMAPIINREWAGRKRSTPLRNHLDQIYYLSKDVPAAYQQYLDWPLAISAAVNEELLSNKTKASKISILQMGDCPGAGSSDLGWA